MYSKRLHFFRKKPGWVENNIIGGVLRKDVEGFPISTPCFALIRPPREAPSVESGMKRPRPKKKGYSSIYSKIAREPIDVYSRLQQLVKNGDKYAIESLLQEIYYEEGIEIFIPFSRMGTSSTIYTTLAAPSQFAYVSKKPFIFDDNFYMAEIAEGNFPIPAFIIYQLSSHRFVNYTLKIGRSNVKKASSSLNKMIDNFKKIYPFNMCDYYYTSKTIRVLIDTLSVSFYRLDDVIPIFDYESGKDGMCMEVVLANSEMSEKHIFDNSITPTFRFLFATSKENIISIDGEKIERGKTLSVNEGVKHINNNIKDNVPNDSINIKTIGC